MVYFKNPSIYTITRSIIIKRTLCINKGCVVTSIYFIRFTITRSIIIKRRLCINKGCILTSIYFIRFTITTSIIIKRHLCINKGCILTSIYFIRFYFYHNICRFFIFFFQNQSIYLISLLLNLSRFFIFIFHFSIHLNHLI